MRKFLTLLSMLVLFSMLAFSQTKEVTGKVTDATGSPISGASIKVKGAKGGTSANESGIFKINVPPNATIVISGVGFITQETKVT